MKQILLHSISFDELLLAIENIIDKKVGGNQAQPADKNLIYLTRKEVASLLRVSLPTVHEYTKHGYLKSYKMGSRVLYKEVEVKDSLERISSIKNKKYLP